tara:strand:+ start:696 stop:929 length:234 start_codon:yes stop_codon:yes gene_type:complete
MGRPTKAKQNNLPPLAEEAKAFTKQKRPKEKPLTSRMYLAGQALSGLLACGKGGGRVEEIKREAYNWADHLLEDEED